MPNTPQRPTQDGENAIMTSQFMTSEEDNNQNNLKPQTSTNQLLKQDQNLLSGGRMSIGNNPSYNPFLYSAGPDSIMGPGKTGGPSVPGETTHPRNFLNTPGLLLTQQQVTEKHREAVNVDAWNVLD